MKHRLLLFAILIVAVATADAQVFTSEPWHQRNNINVRFSQLYGEVGVGINVRPEHKSADFVHLSLGYFRPTRKNAWRKFIPDVVIPQTATDDVRTQLSAMNTDGLHAGLLAAGWTHWFNHSIGIYGQVGWGFVADLSREYIDENTAEMQQQMEEKSTFVYNSVPIEIGLSGCFWQHVTAHIGLTYQWKEIPLLTAGLGYAF